MATATGTWSSSITAGFINSQQPAKDDDCKASKLDLFACLSANPGNADQCHEKSVIYQKCKDALTPHHHYHYTFDVDDNGLDINGFILHHNKHEGKRHKFRVYLDSNENGRFDKNDQLIGRTGLKQKHAAQGVGNLLDEDELGQLEVTFKKPKSNASMRESDDIDAQLFGGSGGDGGTSGNISITNLSFSDSDRDSMADFDKANLGVHTLGAKAAWGQLH